ncbi:MAG: PilZ domain-containing protein, partial [Candidatus Sedimenticola endophacoides]
MGRTTTDQVNRRCYRRTAVNCPATLSIGDRLYTGCTITNFSKDGLYVDTGQDAPPLAASTQHVPEALIEIPAQVAGAASRFLVPVAVSHLDDGGGVGVAFVQEKLKPELVSCLLATRCSATSGIREEGAAGNEIPRGELVAELARLQRVQGERYAQQMIVDLRNALFDAEDRAPDDLTQGALFHGIRLLDQPRVSLPRERFWDIPVPKIDSPTRQPLLPRPSCAHHDS